MEIKTIYNILQEYAPKSLSDEYCAKYDAYDNSGILLNVEKDIHKILFSLDFSSSTLKKAIEQKANLIVTHHPAIYGKLSCLKNEEYIQKNIIQAIENQISIISFHLNLDCAKNGTDEQLMRACGGKDKEILQPLSVENCGYGRVFSISPISLLDLKNRLSTVLNSNRIQLYGKEDKVEKIACFCGAGVDENALEMAYQKGAQVIVSSDFKHHILVGAMERGISVIALTHYASEQYGFEKFYQWIKKKIDISCEYYCDERFL